MANGNGKKDKEAKTNKKLQNKVSIAKLSNRVKVVEAGVGFDYDGRKTGSGIIAIVERIDKAQTELWNRGLALENRMGELEAKVNKIDDTWRDLSFDIRTLNENIKNMEQKIKSFESKIEEHAKVIDKSITPNKLRDIAKDFGIFVAFIMGLGSVFGIIAYLYNRIRG